jgi:regulator of replication initiation timing
LLPNECPKLQKSEILKIQTENEELRKQLTAALESNVKLSAQMQDLQEKLDIIINQFNKQKKKQHDSKTEHHKPRQAYF